MIFKSLLIIGGIVTATQFLMSETVFAASSGEKYAHVEFDKNMLWGTPDTKQSADLSRFSEGNPVPAGFSKADVYLNGALLRAKNVYFAPVAGRQSAQACFTPADILEFGVVLEVLADESSEWLRNDKNKLDCKAIETVVPGAEASFDYSEQRLDVLIPQALIFERSLDYIDPAQWDRGITAGRLNYSADVFNFVNAGDSDTQGFAYFESGFNIAGWRLRNTSILSADEKDHSFQTQRTYAQTDVDSLKSTFTVGRDYTDGQLFSSYGLQGAFLATDIRMLPPSLRNYAPVVSGKADTNAKVTIRQNNVVVYERAVPPGPFEIKNLQMAGYGNDLEVTVTEADGSSKKFNVPYSPLVQLLRPGQMKYSASLGKAWLPVPGDYSPNVGQLNFQYGVNNSLTALGGGILSEDYTAVALGGAISTKYGGFSADYTLSNSRARWGGLSHGDSVRVVYSTLIEPTNTNITLSSYRYSSRGFWSFNEFLSNENNQFNSGSDVEDFYSFYGIKQKGRFDVSLRQRLAPKYGNVFVSGYTRNFWNREGSDTQYQIAYNNRFKDLNYEVSAARVKNQNDREYNEFRLSVSIPIFSSDSTNSQYLSASAWNNSETGSVSQAQLGGIAGDDQQYTYGVTTTQGLDSQNPQQSYGLNGGFNGSKAVITGGVSKGNDYRQTTVGISGSVLAHADGVTFGQTLGETVALIEAKDAGGARITNASGATLDGSGFGVVPYLSPYSRNQIEVDPEGLSMDLQIQNTSAEAIPVAGSVVKVKFETSKETNTLIEGTFEDGTPLPFGAEVFDRASGRSVGFVGQASTVFARGLKDKAELVVKLDGSECVMSYAASQPSAGGTKPGPLTVSRRAVCKLPRSQ